MQRIQSLAVALMAGVVFFIAVTFFSGGPAPFMPRAVAGESCNSCQVKYNNCITGCSSARDAQAVRDCENRCISTWQECNSDCTN